MKEKPDPVKLQVPLFGLVAHVQVPTESIFQVRKGFDS
jgi:hypothetical protein